MIQLGGIATHENLKEEYLFLQAQYEDYDRRSLMIKSWVATGAIAGLALSFNSTNQLVAIVPVFVAIIVGVTWYLEACWKLFQYAFTDRIRIIEAYFRGEQDILIKTLNPFQTYSWWYHTYFNDEPIYDYEKTHRPKPRWRRRARAAFQPYVCLPYLPILILCAISFVILLAQYCSQSN